MNKGKSTVAAYARAKTIAANRNKKFGAKTGLTTPHNDPDFPSVRGKFSPERLGELDDGEDINFDSPSLNHKKNAKSIENVIEIKSLKL
tara:strand:+ start:139 stop:405 length:267 start_codon:yes stop_codon:yes gene_type:complete